MLVFPADFQLGRFPINDATAPAWLMVLLWAAMVVIFVVCFREPTHRYHNHGRRELHTKHHHRRHEEQEEEETQDEEGGGKRDEETAPLTRARRWHEHGQPRGEYGATEAAAAADGGGRQEDDARLQMPPDVPHLLLTPSSTIGSSSLLIPNSPGTKLRQHRLAKIHPMLLLVWRNKPLMITLAGR